MNSHRHWWGISQISWRADFGIVNAVVTPPRRFWVADPERNESYERWLARADKNAGSWWEDWLAWLSPQCGPLVTPPDIDAEVDPELGAAPGPTFLKYNPVFRRAGL